FSGDLDSVEILANTSSSGESIPLIRAKAPGTIILTAASDADINQTASCTLTITENGTTAGSAGTTSPGSSRTPNSHTGIDGDLPITAALLICLVAGITLFVRLKRQQQ
ncbi:MAG: hypothetical protein RR614_08735, partial [Eubacterium sp.]